MRSRVAFNALALRPGGSGVQTYIRELLGQLVDLLDCTLIAAVQDDAVSELPSRITPVVREQADGVRRAIAGLRDLGGADLVHGLDVDLPRRRRCPMVATIHDMAVFDVPWAFPKIRALGEQRLTAASVRRADAIIVMSNFTAERINDRFGRTAQVIPLAPRTDVVAPTERAVHMARATYGLAERFVLHVGNIEPRKDVASLAAACRQAEVPLVLAGARVGSAAVPAGGRAIGYVPTEQLSGLYGAATLVCYPSLYEGFGLPPVEAMACGAPVVATRIPALTEVLGDGAELVPPGDVAALARTLRDLFDNEERRKALGAAGQRRVSLLSWTATATATTDVYRSLGLTT
ncbi:MAG: glycosyltransferase family 4 protein [Actinomycetota bacterium]|nr:glycosyltransferase family 4 protein [Actinomycetota bacterium]